MKKQIILILITLTLSKICLANTHYIHKQYFFHPWRNRNDLHFIQRIKPFTQHYHYPNYYKKIAKIQHKYRINKKLLLTTKIKLTHNYFNPKPTYKASIKLQTNINKKKTIY